MKNEESIEKFNRNLPPLEINANSITFLVQMLDEKPEKVQEITFNLVLNYCAFFEFALERILLFSISKTKKEPFYNYFRNHLVRMSSLDNYLSTIKTIYNIDSTKEKNNPHIKFLKALFYLRNILIHPGYLQSEWKEQGDVYYLETIDNNWNYIKTVLKDEFDISEIRLINNLLLNKKMMIYLFSRAREAIIKLSNDCYGQKIPGYKDTFLETMAIIPSK